jgi:hypothetical protein
VRLGPRTRSSHGWVGDVQFETKKIIFWIGFIVSAVMVVLDLFHPSAMGRRSSLKKI